jgi:hypothetical protein
MHFFLTPVKWDPVTTAWRIEVLRMEDSEEAEDILNKQS